MCFISASKKASRYRAPEFNLAWWCWPAQVHPCESLPGKSHGMEEQREHAYRRQADPEERARGWSARGPVLPPNSLMRWGERERPSVMPRELPAQKEISGIGGNPFPLTIGYRNITKKLNHNRNKNITPSLFPLQFGKIIRLFHVSKFSCLAIEGQLYSHFLYEISIVLPTPASHIYWDSIFIGLCFVVSTCMFCLLSS